MCSVKFDGDYVLDKRKASLTPFADDSHRNFESGDANAQPSEAKTKGASLERPRETSASPGRAVSARCLAPDAGEDMIWAGLGI
jgi:hypothetical protein